MKSALTNVDICFFLSKCASALLFLKFLIGALFCSKGVKFVFTEGHTSIFVDFKGLFVKNFDISLLTSTKMSGTMSEHS